MIRNGLYNTLEHIISIGSFDNKKYEINVYNYHRVKEVLKSSYPSIIINKQNNYIELILEHTFSSNYFPEGEKYVIHVFNNNKIKHNIPWNKRKILSNIIDFLETDVLIEIEKKKNIKLKEKISKYKKVINIVNNIETLSECSRRMNSLMIKGDSYWDFYISEIVYCDELMAITVDPIILNNLEETIKLGKTYSIYLNMGKTFNKMDRVEVFNLNDKSRDIENNFFDLLIYRTGNWEEYLNQITINWNNKLVEIKKRENELRNKKNELETSKQQKVLRLTPINDTHLFLRKND